MYHRDPLLAIVAGFESFNYLIISPNFYHCYFILSQAARFEPLLMLVRCFAEMHGEMRKLKVLTRGHQKLGLVLG